MAEVRDLEPEELERWREAGHDHLLLDVRTSEELRLAAIAGAMHVPMSEIRLRLPEIPRGKPVVVICHHGGRSYAVATFLAGSGFTDVYNLEGGIDAYSRVDPAVPRY